MLEFIIGRAGSGKTTACLNTIKEKLIHSPTGKPLVILLPDHMTFAIERQLALELKDYGGGVVWCFFCLGHEQTCLSSINALRWDTPSTSQ